MTLLILTTEKRYGEDETIGHTVLQVPKGETPRQAIRYWLRTFWGKDTRMEDGCFVRRDGCAALKLLNWRKIRHRDEAVIQRYFNVDAVMDVD
jgi:hypothetical protein